MIKICEPKKEHAIITTVNNILFIVVAHEPPAPVANGVIARSIATWQSGPLPWWHLFVCNVYEQFLFIDIKVFFLRILLLVASQYPIRHCEPTCWRGNPVEKKTFTSANDLLFVVVAHEQLAHIYEERNAFTKKTICGCADGLFFVLTIQI